MGLMFWDGPCPDCNGEGVIEGKLCPECAGTGMIGGADEVKPLPDYVKNNCVGQKLRHTREQRRISMSDLASEFGWGLIHLSNIERGREYPSIDEQVQIMEWIDG